MVHGYSVYELNTYGRIPMLLAASGVQPQNILLSAYISLDDRVSCGDLAIALDDHIAGLGLTDDDLRQTAMVCHSTGAIVTRRWILNRLAKGRGLPSHLITAAGANHGSSLAQVGRTAIARVFRGLVQQRPVGEGLLADLDYGSTFLLTLNREWLSAWNAGLRSQVFCFSFGGDKHWMDEPQFPEVPGWQFLEPGSDSIVRVSGANLNYSVVTADAAAGTLRYETLNQPAAHLVISGYTHGGVLGGVQNASEAPYVALLQALQVGDAAGYESVVADWRQRTATWSAQNPPQVNATIVFRLRDDTGRPVNDSWILLQDPGQSASRVSDSLLPHQPIQNESEHSSISFYVNYDGFQTSHPHKIHVEAHSGSPNINYKAVDYANAAETHMVRPNEFTYVDVTIPRDVENTYAIVRYDPALNVNKPWPPLPS